jgi:hypothetical protein
VRLPKDAACRELEGNASKKASQQWKNMVVECDQLPSRLIASSFLPYLYFNTSDGYLWTLGTFHSK